MASIIVSVNLPEIMESMIGCTCGLRRFACSIAANDRYEAMFLDNSLFPLCKNLTATGKARSITDFLL